MGGSKLQKKSEVNVRCALELSPHRRPIFMEVNNLEVEEAFFTMPTFAWTEGVWLENGEKGIQRLGGSRFFEVQAWRRVRGPAGAVMCETLDLDVMWPQWHTLLVEGQVVVDMRVVGPQDVEKMLLKQATTVH